MHVGRRGAAGRGALAPKSHVSVRIGFNWESKDSFTHEVSNRLRVAFQDGNIKGRSSSRHANYPADLSSQEKQRLAPSFCSENAFIC